MKTLQTLLSDTAAVYHTTAEDVSDSIRVLLAFLMEDPEFRAVWEEIPRSDALSDEELLLALMIAGGQNETTDTP